MCKFRAPYLHACSACCSLLFIDQKHSNHCYMIQQIMKIPDNTSLITTCQPFPAWPHASYSEIRDDVRGRYKGGESPHMQPHVFGAHGCKLVSLRIRNVSQLANGDHAAHAPRRGVCTGHPRCCQALLVLQHSREGRDYRNGKGFTASLASLPKAPPKCISV